MAADARLVELEFLSRLERADVEAGPYERKSSDLRLMLHLVTSGLAWDTDSIPGADVSFGSVNKWLELSPKGAVLKLLGGVKTTTLTITHAGAVRRAELEQQLKSGRIKETMGLIWDGRHFRQDTRIALLDASPETPLGVVYLDLNDVKAFNAKSHATGDTAIRRYLEVVAELTYDNGDAYRLSGGADEVVVLLPRNTEADALAWTRKLLGALGRELIADISLRAAAGVVVATQPDESVEALKDRADAQQLRAKASSKEDPTRPSRVAWVGGCA